MPHIQLNYPTDTKPVYVCVQFDEAEALSQTVVCMGEEAGEFLPRAYLSLGLSCSLQASEGTVRVHTPYCDCHHQKINSMSHLFKCIKASVFIISLTSKRTQNHLGGVKEEWYIQSVTTTVVGRLYLKGISSTFSQ